ncbi:hypothetical protein AGI3411_04284 [Achromobacter agilis]|uniref:Uncharacterized protein n=1 Tax=Achromobacter agilis TaxID=1353888 RepID=A0A446CPC3_9BURK|nr:hypothetical protein AGI3411_04284 [Achromobacter agilis]
MVLEVTFCCGVLFRLPAFWAWTRNRWTESMTASGCARKASPTDFTQSGCRPIMSMTDGKATRDLTLGSQVSPSTALTALSPDSDVCWADHLAAAAMSSG